jgi:hypothetical protein
VRLTDEEIDAIAHRVAELIHNPAAGTVRFVDAQRVAEVLGVDREWVYAHARALGAVRLGGPRGRLRFDLQRVQRALPDARPAAPSPPPTPPQRRPRRALRGRVDLLPYES